MSFFDNNLPDMLGALSDFDKIHESTLDADGLIEGPFIPLRDLVIFPQMMMPLFVGRPKSLEAIGIAQEEERTVICATQKDPDVEDPKVGDIYDIGVEVIPGRTLRVPDGTVSVLVQGLRRVQIVEITQTVPYYRVKARPIEEQTKLTTEIEASMRAVLTLFERCVHLNRNLSEDAYVFAMNIDDP
ncbi:MAG: endopeptidase La, partial [Planctomycetes bacterium]|nr:endopeptidase La [Planctomycetota bacterium]